MIIDIIWLLCYNKNGDLMNFKSENDKQLYIKEIK